MYKLGQINIDGQSTNVEHIDLCPVCNTRSVMPQVLCKSVSGVPHVLESVHQCGNHSCRCFAIVRYRSNGPNPVRYKIMEIVPIRESVTNFHDAIIAISPTFVEVFNQAERARQLGLAYIAGPGFRKAFEFLIKDYAISLAPDKAAEVKATFAAQVVRDHISDARIQAVAKRALWVGNDETHYERRWEDKDIDDLIVLIEITAKWIETDSLTKSYLEEMPDGRP